jgi:hypothetical protein
MAILNTKNDILNTFMESLQETWGLTLISNRKDIKYLEEDINRYN